MSKCLLILWLQTAYAVILEPRKIKYVFFSTGNESGNQFHFSPIYLPWSDGNGCHGFSFLNAEILNPLFHSLLSHSPRGSLVPLRFLPLESRNGIICISGVVDISPTNIIPASDSSSPAFHMVDSAYKLTKQRDNIQSHCTPFPLWTSLLFHIWF